MKFAEIHRQLIEVYGEKVLSDGMKKKTVNEKISGNRRFTIRVFLHKKMDSRGRRFDNNDYANDGVRQWLSSMAGSLYKETMLTM